MRQIGTLPRSADPKVLEDHLLSLGVSSKITESKDGWAVWVHDENKLALAREEFAAYTQNPDDPRYTQAKQLAEDARRQQERLDREYRRNVRNVSGAWNSANLRRRPLTVALMAVCVGVFLFGQTDARRENLLRDRFEFFPLSIARQGTSDLNHALEAIHSGEVWRLVTPIFLHPGGWIHLGFNMWALSVLGSLIEFRRGTMTLFWLVLLSGVASNVGQLIYSLNFDPVLVGWGGFSGVVYALFGYVWMKGRAEPEHGMMLHPNSVRTMLLWLLLGFTGLFNLRMANGAHLVGLIVGALFGLARF
ncbi:MAG: rhomboid family intramembrane serine protease [Isosphaeraceae bacterium]